MPPKSPRPTWAPFQLAPLRKQSAARFGQRGEQVQCARHEDKQPAIESEKSRTRPPADPTNSHLNACRRSRSARKIIIVAIATPASIDRCVGPRAAVIPDFSVIDSSERNRRPPPAARCRRRRSRQFAYLARKPASFIRAWCSFSAASTHFTYSGPVMKLVLKAPFFMKSAHSGVSRTFLKTSM